MPYILCALKNAKCQAAKEVPSRQLSCSWSQLETCSLCKGKGHQIQLFLGLTAQHIYFS